VIPFAALAGGTSTYLIPRMTEHVESRLWLIQKMLGAGVEVKGNRVAIEGIGMKRAVNS
jgi:RNA 3'-terminal phosphate cyclase (ATP)